MTDKKSTTNKKKSTTRFRMTNPRITYEKNILVKGRSNIGNSIINTNPFISNEIPFSKLENRVIQLPPFNIQKRQSGGAPGDETFNMFGMTDAQLRNIARHQQQNDCVVTSLRTLDLIDDPTENMLRRMLAYYPTGIRQELLEYILNLRLLGRYMFRFRHTNDWAAFTGRIQTLVAGHAFICGTENHLGQSHVFLIARNQQDQYVKIESHANPTVCVIAPASNCLQQMLPPGIQGARNYFIMTAIEL